MRRLRAVGLWIVLISFVFLGLVRAQSPERPASARARLWAIVVGIDDYQDAAIGDGVSSVRSANRVRSWFRTTSGWADDHVLYLTDGGVTSPGPSARPEPNILASRSNLDWAFRDWLKDRAKQDDVVVVYFAGRTRAAVSPAPEPGIEGQADHYLLPVDAKLGDVRGTGWSLDAALDNLAERTRCHVLSLLATAAPEAGGARPGGARAVPSAELWLGKLARWPGASAWVAASDILDDTKFDPASGFTEALLHDLGTPDKPNNLAGCLRALRQRPDLQARGFRAVGGVPPNLSLWSRAFDNVNPDAKPEIVVQLGHADRITQIAASADGRQMMTASMDSTVRVWSLAERALLRTYAEHMVGATAMALSEDGRWLVSGGGRGKVAVRDLSRDGAIVLAPRLLHPTAIRSVVFLPDGVHLVSMDSDGGTYLWNLSKLPLEPKPWLPDEECIQVVATGVAAGDQGKVAALTGRGKILVFAPNGSNGQALELDAKEATTIAIAPDGRSLAVGFADGTAVRRDLVAGNDVTHEGPGPVTRLELSSTGALAVGRVSGVHLLRAGRSVALTDWPPGRLAFSADGRFLAACAVATGAIRVWRVDGEAQSPPAVLAEDDARAACVGFTGDNATLLTGATDGSLEAWRIEGDKGVRGWHVAASRGRVRQASPAPTRRLLALLNDSNEAQVLDLEGRVCRRVPGRWTSATFLDDDRLLATAAIDAPKHAGDVLAIDAKTFQINDLHFARTSDRYNVSPEVVFERVSISPDRSRVAATASVDQTPLVVVWDAKTGRLTHALTHLEDPVRCLSFSNDGRLLLTSGDAPSADIWDLSRAEGVLDKPSASCIDAAGRHVTQSLIRPGADSKLQIVTGHSDGRVSLWSYQAPKLELVEGDFTRGAFSRAILALAFSNDGNTLAAAGDANSIWLGDFTGRPKALPDFAERPHHFEQINALAVWPGTTGQGMLVSASDDATVRFWDIAGRTLKGTFRAAVLDPDVEKLPVPTLDWVLYTPEGRFDASDGRAAVKLGDGGGKDAAERRLDAADGGRGLVRFRLRDDPRSLGQFDASLFTFQLGEKLLTNEIIPPPRKLEEPPLITIDPPDRQDDSKPSAVLTLSLNATDVTDVRLYHNGVPVPCGVDVEGRTSAARKIQVPVRLLEGVNRFYAMAGRETTYDSRSRDIELTYDGIQPPGQVHVVALGVGDYHRNRRLKYPRNDALALSEVLEERSKREGLTIIRTDDEVTEANVKHAFDTVAARVADRPQDTVVVFLAGHTGIFDKDKFCLLLPNFPFPPGGPELVAARDAPPIDPKTELRPEHLLAYEVVARQFRKLGALRRLVIVDACQAEAILSDTRVKKIQEWMEIGSRKARTAYLMAARQGEPALEVDPLRHGLFTYSLLHGLGKIQPADEPEEIRKLSLPVDADFDRDGEVTTGELDAYVRDALPRITSVYPDLVTRRRAVEVSAPRVGPAEVLARETSLQSARVSFPLVPVR